MSLCVDRGLEVTIVNLFTRSAYAPYLASASVDEVTRVRLSEDEHLLQALGPKIRMLDLELDDAPARLGISAEQVLRRPISQERFRSEVEGLMRALELLREFDLTVLPLGIGEHVDHCIAREAGMLSLPPGQIAFYEDLPYASWVDQHDRLTNEKKIGIAGSPELTPMIFRTTGGAAIKFACSCIYGSQISKEVAGDISRYASDLEEGERFYIPKGILRRLSESLA